MTRPDGPAPWRAMSGAELDRAYDNAGAVPDSAARLADWAARSARLRAERPELLDLRYGLRERNRVDVFRSGADAAPLFVFVHGGYWQRNSKEVFAFAAEGPLALGLDVALVGYTLAPDATLGAIVEEVRAAIRFLRREGPARGFGRGRLVLSGWSAGGHLTACCMDMAEVDAGLTISGVFDLEPIRRTNLNDKLRLTAADAEALSPVRHPPARAGPLVVAWGAEELPELQRQSKEHEAAWAGSGLPGRALPLAGHDHFSILEELSRPELNLARTVAQLSSE